MSFRRAIRTGQTWGIIGPATGDHWVDGDDSRAYALDTDKIAERAAWLDDYTFQMTRHGHGAATTETYQAAWDPRARPYTLTPRGAERWTYPGSRRLIRGAWRVSLIDSRASASAEDQDIAGRILERELSSREDY